MELHFSVVPPYPSQYPDYVILVLGSGTAAFLKAKIFDLVLGGGWLGGRRFENLVWSFTKKLECLGSCYS